MNQGLDIVSTNYQGRQGLCSFKMFFHYGLELLHNLIDTLGV